MAVCGSAGSIIAHDRVQHDRGVGDGARDRPADILRAGERNDPTATGQPLGPADSYQAIVRGGNADRTASVAAHPRSSEVGGDRCTSAAAGTTRVEVRRVGVTSLTEQRAEGGD